MHTLATKVSLTVATEEEALYLERALRTGSLVVMTSSDNARGAEEIPITISSKV